MENVPLTVSQAREYINSVLNEAIPALIIKGEVSRVDVWRNTYVYITLKDEEALLDCFTVPARLRFPIEEGMMVQAVVSPTITKKGKFSLTIQEMMPLGEGSIKRSFDLMKARLEKEGLFGVERKRPLPLQPSHVGVITSTQAAGYVDFVTILNERWGGMKVDVANTQVQGLQAAKQIIRAIEHFNQLPKLPEVLVIVRGGGSAEDLSVFNDEQLVRAIAASRIPTVVGVGHEIDVTLADLVADKRAATPSNAAQLLVPDRNELFARHRHILDAIRGQLSRRVTELNDQLVDGRTFVRRRLTVRIEQIERDAYQMLRTLKQLDPNNILKRGYALVRGSDGAVIKDGHMPKVGEQLTIELEKAILKAGVKDVRKKR